jgi:hypothetical protein
VDIVDLDDIEVDLLDVSFYVFLLGDLGGMEDDNVDVVLVVEETDDTLLSYEFFPLFLPVLHLDEVVDVDEPDELDECFCYSSISIQ